MVLTRTAKSCRSDAPIVGVKSAIRSAGDGVKKRGHRGEREVSRKTIARGMPDYSGEPVVTTLVCFFHCIRGCGCIGHPAFPAPSYQRRERFLQNPDASRRGNAESCFGNWGNVIARSERTLTVIASEAKQSTLSLRGANGGLLRGVCPSGGSKAPSVPIQTTVSGSWRGC